MFVKSSAVTSGAVKSQSSMITLAVLVNEVARSHNHPFTSLGRGSGSGQFPRIWAGVQRVVLTRLEKDKGALLRLRGPGYVALVSLTFCLFVRWM